MTMSQGEKMVWAAVFAAKYQYAIDNETKLAPPSVFVPGNGEKWNKWEMDQAANAMAAAYYAVQRLRELHGTCCGDIGAMLVEMLGVET